MNPIFQITSVIGITLLFLFNVTVAYGNTYKLWTMEDYAASLKDTIIDQIDMLELPQTPRESMQRISLDETVKLFPNPTTSGFTIQSTDLIEIVYVYGTAGQLIQSFFPNTSSIQVDLADLPPGMYVVKCFTDAQDRAINRKVMKQ